MIPSDSSLDSLRPYTVGELMLLEALFGVEVDPDTYRCGLTWPIHHGEDPDYEGCSAEAVACWEDQGRCIEHLPEFEYLEHWGFIPKPKFVLELLDTPTFFRNERPRLVIE